MSDVFISYRRDDTGDVVDRLERTLQELLPDFDIFRDTGGIAPAEDYLDVLQQEVERSLVFLPVIGDQWSGKQGGGRRRIDNPEDVLRREVEWRLRGSRPILPLLVDGALMPAAGDLPRKMRDMARKNAARLSRASFDRDASALATRLRDLVEEERKAQQEAEEEIDRLAADLDMDDDTAPGLQDTGLGVPVFSPEGKWLLTITSPTAPDIVAGPLGKAQLEFTIGEDRSMRGEYRHLIGKKFFGGEKFGSDPIEGEGFLFMRTGSTEIAEKMHIQGVARHSERFALTIPVQIKTGNIYIGTDEYGREFTLKLLKGGGGRVGF